MDKQPYEYLTYFFSAYYTNIWVDEVTHQGLEGYKEIIQDFMNGETSERVFKTVIELNTLIEEKIPEQELREFVTRNLGANVYPPNSGLTYQQWLEWVLNILKESE